MRKSAEDAGRLWALGVLRLFSHPLGFIYDGRGLKRKGALEGMEDMQSIYKLADQPVNVLRR
jgi:hypothetical protein